MCSVIVLMSHWTESGRGCSLIPSLLGGCCSMELYFTFFGFSSRSYIRKKLNQGPRQPRGEWASAPQGAGTDAPKAAPATAAPLDCSKDRACSGNIPKSHTPCTVAYTYADGFSMSDLFCHNRKGEVEQERLIVGPCIACSFAFSCCTCSCDSILCAPVDCNEARAP